MYVKVSFDKIYDKFQIFGDDRMKITMYKNGDVNPSSVIIQPDTGLPDVCEPYRAANEIKCSYLTMYCTFANDIIHIHIVRNT